MMRNFRQAPLVIEPARTDEWAAAIRLSFRHLDSPELESRLKNALEMIRRNELNPAGIIVARDGDYLRGALICQPMPGGSGLIWPPQTTPKNLRSIQDQLTRFACRWLADEGAKLIQSLLLPEESAMAKSLQGNGFAKITRLCYLRHQLKLPAPHPNPPPPVAGTLRVPVAQGTRSVPATVGGEQAGGNRLLYQSYDRCDQELFNQTLLCTYEQTQDCPEVSGVRTIAEIIAGHKSQGIHDPRHWWLACHESQPVGVLLLAEMQDGKGWDILYLGVAAEARRRGFGRELTRKAIWEAQAGQASQLTLAVDARNRPARSLYESLGFQAFDERDVYLKRLG